MDKINKASLAVAVFVLGVIGGGAAAFADTIPADPTGGALDDGKDYITNFVITYAVPVVLALTLLGIGIKLGLRWLKRAGRAAG